MSYSSYQNQHLQPAWDNAPPMPAQNLPRHPGGQFPPRFPHDYHPRAPPRSSFQFDPRFQPSTSVPNPSVRSDDIKVLVEEDDGGWERGYPAHQQVHPSKQSPNQMTKPVHQMPPDDVHHDHAHPLEHSKTDERNARLDKVKQSVPMDHDMENSQSSHFESAVNQNSKVVESQHSDFIQASQAVDHAPESPASAATQDPQNTPSSINVSASSTRVDSANLSSPHANLASDSHDKTTMPNGSNTYRQSPLVEVPTWRGPVPGSFQRAIAEVDCDSNRVVVPHPRQWGASSLPQAASVSQNPIGGDHRSENHVVDSITSPASRQGDWDHNARLQNWADSVQTLSPPEAVDPPSTVLRTPSPPDRPDSVPLAPRPVTAYVSEDEESIPLDPGSQTKDDDQSPKSPAVLSVSAEVNGQEITLDKEVDEQSPERTGVLRRNRFERNSSIRSSSQFHAHRGGAFRGPRQNRLADDRGAYYKRPPHPIYHPKFADRRLLVQFPYSIRNDVMRQGLLDHFSRYGTVWRALPHESNGDASEKAYVIFEEAEGVRRCLADPKRCECHLRSATRFGNTSLELTITHAPPLGNTRTVFVQVLGDRSDSDSRSASPCRSRRTDMSDSAQPPRDARHDLPSEKQDLPPTVSVYAAPVRFWRNDRVNWWARILPPSIPWINVVNKSVAETGTEPVKLNEVDMHKRVPEKDFIPLLCDYFAEICEIFPPTSKEQGWLICVAGPNEGRHLIDEMSKIPGLKARWAVEADGAGQIDNLSQAAGEKRDLSPLSRLERDTEGPLARHGRPVKHKYERHEDSSVNRTHVDGQLSEGGVVDTPLVTAPILTPIIPSYPNNEPSSMPCEIHTTPDRYHPSLRRVLMYTYKGRRLEERMVNGEPKYFDRAAVFVGRLVKEQETKETLFHRFRKYGAINDIEYNPTSCQATYATARVLYNMEDAAQRAISNEHEAVSFGSRIKVEPRKVLPLDVQTREMFMDHLGRPVSPSMVSQYSPPSVPFQPQVPLPPPPPPLEPWTVPTLAPGPMMVPNAPAHLPLLLGGPLVPPPGNIETSSTAAQSPNIPSPPVQSGSVIPLLYTYGIGYLPSQIPPALLPRPPMGYESMPATNAPEDPLEASPSDKSTIMPSSKTPTEYEYVGHTIVTSGYQSTASEGKPLRSIGHRYEHGVFKLLYDAEELRRYRHEHGIPEPPCPDASQLYTADDLDLPLLPIQSGGHEQVGSSTLRRSSIGGPSDMQHSSVGYRCVPVPVPFSPPAETAMPRPVHGRSRKGSNRIPVPPLEGFDDMRTSLPALNG